MNYLHIDFETRSTVDLKKCGADVYARHPSTDIMCMGYAVDNHPVHMWLPESPPHVLASFVQPESYTFIAHNAAFELAIWNNVGVRKYGWQPIKPEQVICTMAMAYAMALPGALDKAAAAVGLDHQKDMAGGRVMLQLSQPRELTPCIDCMGEGFNEWKTSLDCPPAKTPCPVCRGLGQTVVWWEDKDKYERMYAYCKQDIEVERELFKRLMQLSPDERFLWELDQKINQRGVAVDLKAVKTAIELVNAEKKRLDSEMRTITNNGVATCTATAQLGHWLKSCGVEVDGVAKADVLELLSRSDLPKACRKALLLRQEAAKSSTAKLESMAASACNDGRIRGIFQYHGAGTGRWAGRRIQPQNFPRPKINQNEVEEIFQILGDVK